MIKVKTASEESLKKKIGVRDPIIRKDTPKKLNRIEAETKWLKQELTELTDAAKLANQAVEDATTTADSRVKAELELKMISEKLEAIKKIEKKKI